MSLSLWRMSVRSRCNTIFTFDPVRLFQVYYLCVTIIAVVNEMGGEVRASRRGRELQSDISDWDRGGEKDHAD